MFDKHSIFLKNVVSMLTANGISFLVSALITLIIPKYLNIEKYSYIQLYIFYTSYISYLHYGWVDGVRLRYAGSYYDSLDKPLFGSQVWLYSLLQLIVAFLVIGAVVSSHVYGDKKTVLLSVGLCMCIRLPRLMPQYILEMTNRIKECAKITIMERVIFLGSIIIIIIKGKASVFNLICCDLAGQVFSAIYAFWACRDLISVKPCRLIPALIEAWENICSGIQLTLANVSGFLVIGIIRQFIEYQWSVKTFGKISLTLSISNLLMVFIRSVSQVFFPSLRRVDKNTQLQIYGRIRTGLMTVLFGVLIFYYPVQVIVVRWLPKYEDSLRYMAILFPMCIFESKMSMLIETYLKTLRMERFLLKINFVALLLSIFCSIITIIWLENLTLAVFSIVFILAFRSVVAEIILTKRININVFKSICLELLLVFLFVFVNWTFGGLTGFTLYFIFYLLYFILVHKELKTLIRKA